MLKFLKSLSANNNKEWMDANRDWYLESRAYFLKEVEVLLHRLSTLQPAYGVLAPKDCVFRQNRDIRFSKDKRPYKENFAAYFSPQGKKSPGPGFYIHIQPEASFLAGGVWMPPPEELKKIRQEIDYAGKELVNILEQPAFLDYFGSLEGEQLKSSPKGYDANHPFINLLNYKSFILSKPLDDASITSGDYKEIAVYSFNMMQPFLGFLQRAMVQSDGGADLL
jgi:uncharacterized protein (TIGR02453 family)